MKTLVGYISESAASDQAKKAGLVNKGGNAWGKEKGGSTVAKTVDGKLVSVGDGEDKPKADKPKDDEPKTDVEPEKEPSTKSDTSKDISHTKASPAQQTEINKINAGVKEDLDFIIANAGDVRTQGGAGTNSASKKQVQDLGTFTEKRMAQGPDEEPYVHPDVVQREIDDATLDKSIDYLEKSLGDEKFENLVRFISRGGGVDPFLTKVTKKEGKVDKDSVGYKRSKEIIKLYLKNDGKCVVTGERMKLSECEPDHRLPYSSAGALAKEKNIPINEAKKQMDNIGGNMDLMFGPVNQFKSSLINDKLLNKIRKDLVQTDDEREIKKLEDQYTNERRKRLNSFYIESFGKGDFRSMTEQNIMDLDKDERNTMMKSYNYYHPNTKELRDQMKKDPDYLNKLEKKGIKLPFKDREKLILDPDQPPSKFWLNRNVIDTSGKRPRANRRSREDEIPAMIEMFKASGKNVISIADEKASDSAIDKNRMSIRKEMNKKQIEIELIKLQNPKLSDKQKDKIQANIDKLKEQRELLRAKEMLNVKSLLEWVV